MSSEVEAQIIPAVERKEQHLDETRESARRLLDLGCTGIIGLRKRWGHVGPYVFTSKDELKDLVLEPKYLLSDLLRHMLDHNPEGKYGILARGCDLRALKRLENRGAVDPNRVVIIGVVCDAEMAEKCNCLHPEAPVAKVDIEKCSGCRTCEEACPYNAISLVEHEGGWKTAEVNEFLCKGCGTCVPACPSRAIGQYGFTDNQQVSQVLEATESGMGDEEPNIVGFCCSWCSYTGADIAGVSEPQYPPNIRIIRTMCSGRVDPIWILRAFMAGADGVFVSSCHPGDCHYMTGNDHTSERIQRLKKTLEDYGIDPRRLTLEWISANEENRYAELVTKFTKEIKNLGLGHLIKNKKGGV
jgi:coenzyme F420-reducing hydrogenase delta subunit/NAD-dependent dihydropyrimidine dehydrogenase PreA subunit